MDNYDYSLLTIEDFSEGFRDVVEAVGMEAAYKLCFAAGGNYIYVPKIDSIQKRLRDLSIKNDYRNGMTIDQLCKKYNLSFNQIRGICSLAYMRQLSVSEFLDKSE